MALGSINTVYCPGGLLHGEIHGDGFYAFLDGATLGVAPSDVVAIAVTGLSKPRFEATLGVVRDYSGGGYDHLWELRAPDGPGTYEIDIDTYWSHGAGHCRIRLVVARD